MIATTTRACCWRISRSQWTGSRGSSPTVLRSSASLGAGVADVARLASSIGATGAPIVLVIDQVEALTSAECKDMIAELILRLPSGSQVAMGSRHEVPGRSRAFVPRATSSRSERPISPCTPRKPARCCPKPGSNSEPKRSGLGGQNRRVAGGPLPGGARDERRQCERPASSSASPARDRFMGDYLRTEFLDPVSRQRRHVPHAYVDPRSAVGTVVRCHRGPPGIWSTARSSAADQPAGDPAGSGWSVVPLPPPVPRHVVRRALAARAGDDPRATRPGRLVVRGQQPAGGSGRARSASTRPKRVERLVLNIANPVWASGRLDTVLRWMEWFARRARSRTTRPWLCMGH